MRLALVRPGDELQVMGPIRKDNVPYYLSIVEGEMADTSKTFLPRGSQLYVALYHQRPAAYVLGTRDRGKFHVFGSHISDMNAPENHEAFLKQVVERIL